jgi:hypothetical protein
MSQNDRQQQRLDPATSRTLASAIVGNENATVQSGNYIVHKGRIFSGKKNRLLGLLDHLQTIGCDTRRIDAIRVSVAGNTIGFCKEIPDYGERGEALIALIGAELPKKENIREGGTGILSRGQPQPQPQNGGNEV